MRKIFFLTIFIVFSINLTCLFAQEGKYKILAIQHQTFGPYTSSFNGFKIGIMESDYSDRIEIEKYNANTDLKALDNYLEKLKIRKDVHLVFSIGTQATKRVVKQTKHIPVVFTDLGAPGYSGIISDWKTSKSNYTGVETRNYIPLGINLLHELISFKKLGLIYLKDAPSHEGAVKQITTLSKEAGFEFIQKSFTYRDKNGKKLSNKILRKGIAEALGHVVPKVDVFYVQVSKTFDINFDLFLESFKKFNIPSAGDPLYIKKGLVMGIGRDKGQFGKQCAAYAVNILKGTDPASLPMDVGKKFSISLNIKAASIVGYNPSIDILSAADEIYKDLDIKK